MTSMKGSITMRQKLINVLRKTLIIIMCIVTLSSAIISSIPVARADSSGILGTNNALGSPILNANFAVDDWNKWEMICWGVFLSNFCQPLIDDYEKAFKTGAGGSEGAGYRALCFGSGSDCVNAEVIQAFCDYAILEQQSSTQAQVYVTYTYIECSAGVNSITIDDSKADPNVSSDAAREAHFSDFFFKTGITEGRASSNMVDVSLGLSSYSFSNEYAKVAHLGKVYVPTFWIRNTDGKYTKILDYTETWDVQIMSAIINAVRSSNSKDAFATKFNSLWDDSDTTDFTTNSNDLVSMDVFGNLMVDNTILFPAAANPNITETRSINLLNSWVFNSYNSTYSKEQLQNKLSQDDSWVGSGILGGQPAFTTSDITGVGLLYYDLDSIMVYDYESSQNMGEAIKKLFQCDISRNDNKYPLEFELTGAKEHDDYKNWIRNIDSLSMSSLTSSFLVNVPISSRSRIQPEMLHYLIAMDGTKIELFNSEPVIIAPQLDKSNNYAIITRALYSFLYDIYKKNIVETSAGTINYTNVLKLFEQKTFAGFKSFINTNFLDQFISTDSDFKNYKIKSDWTTIDSNSMTADTNRLCLVYPISETLKSVSAVLGSQDGSEFNTYSTLIYMTYLDWYGVVDTKSFTSGNEKKSNFNPDIYTEDLSVLNTDINGLANFKSQEDKEQEILEMNYLLLHPEDGRSYRKNLIYNGMSDFLYEQYNRIVYGGSSDNYNGSASKSNSGFLAVETYSDNWLTSWFLDSYVDIAVWMIGICTILLVIIGLLKSKKLSWYMFGIFTIINVILLVPSSGELVPYITSSFTQNMFSSKMTAWSMAEGIANANLEADAANQEGDMASLNAEEAKTAIKLIKQLNVVYIDRSLMLKQDISQKLTQRLGGVYTEIQQLPSARWILPMVMQQFSNEEDVQGSLYVKLSNVWDDASNLYWYYDPNEAATVTKPTTTSEQFSVILTGEALANVAEDIEKRW